ncbi:hypothetical protein NDU88_002302 [Pleurodeles waltl]|uniref:Uncharacterized protein n=1 Tax=Pleurodeles waltl TaxID=8319 RepID=A0AAV7SAI8_PLEWA|nr:hypothetical protein NDU88_002302 [Pleurodeles waltl]
MGYAGAPAALACLLFNPYSPGCPWGVPAFFPFTFFTALCSSAPDRFPSLACCSADTWGPALHFLAGIQPERRPARPVPRATFGDSPPRSRPEKLLIPSPDPPFVPTPLAAPLTLPAGATRGGEHAATAAATPAEALRAGRVGASAPSFNKSSRPAWRSSATASRTFASVSILVKSAHSFQQRPPDEGNLYKTQIKYMPPLYTAVRSRPTKTKEGGVDTGGEGMAGKNKTRDVEKDTYEQ